MAISLCSSSKNGLLTVSAKLKENIAIYISPVILIYTIFSFVFSDHIIMLQTEKPPEHIEDIETMDIPR